MLAREPIALLPERGLADSRIALEQQCLPARGHSPQKRLERQQLLAPANHLGCHRTLPAGDRAHAHLPAAPPPRLSPCPHCGPRMTTKGSTVRVRQRAQQAAEIEPMYRAVAELNSRSSLSRRCSTATNSARTDSGSRTSQRIATASLPTSTAAASSGSGRRPASTSVNPAFDKATADARPMPLPAPVTSATRLTRQPSRSVHRARPRYRPARSARSSRRRETRDRGRVAHRTVVANPRRCASPSRPAHS